MLSSPKSIGIPVVKRKLASAAATVKIGKVEKTIDLVSPKRTATVVTRTIRRTSRAAAAADKIRNYLLDHASPINKENAKEPADVVLRENDTVITDSNNNMREKHADVVPSVKGVPCVKES